MDILLTLSLVIEGGSIEIEICVGFLCLGPFFAERQC